MKTLRVGIASYEEMKARSLAIVRGSYKPSADEPKVWFTSAESFARILSNRNRALLPALSVQHFQGLSNFQKDFGVDFLRNRSDFFFGQSKSFRQTGQKLSRVSKAKNNHAGFRAKFPQFVHV